MTATVRWANVKTILNAVRGNRAHPLDIGDSRVCVGHLGRDIVLQLDREDERGWSITIQKAAL